MLEGINVEEIKRYNESLRAHNERATKLKAEIEFNTVELNRLCAELSAELGIQVTIENLENIYNDRVAKINDTLKTGTEILRRIAEEEASANAAPINNSLGAMGTAPQQAPNINGMTMPLGPIGTIGTPAQQAAFNQGNTNNMFSSLDGGKELFGETPARPTFPGEGIKI